MDTEEELGHLQRYWWRVPFIIGLLLLLPYIWCRTYNTWSSHRTYAVDREMKKVWECDTCTTQFKSNNRLLRPACSVCGSTVTVKHEDLPLRPAPSRIASMQYNHTVEELEFTTTR